MPRTSRSALLVALVAGCMSLSSVHAQNPCETALLSAADVIEVTPGSPFTVVSTAAEWESEILKFRVSSTGLLGLGVAGEGAEVSLQIQQGTGLQMINGAPLEPGATVLTPVDSSEVYCLHVAPETAGAGSLAVQLHLTDICKLGPGVDDHGDSFACATEIAIGAGADGIMTAGDPDVFAFSLAAAGQVDVQSSGGTGVSGQLFDAAGALLTAEEDRGSGLGFLISESLPAGRYFLRVEGAGSTSGAYRIDLDPEP